MMATQIKNQETKDFRTKTLPSYALIIIWVFFIAFSSFQQKKTNSLLEDIKSEATTWGNVAENVVIEFWTWDEIGTWWNILTWDTILTWEVERELTDEEKYISLKNLWNYRSFYPASQWRTNGDYATNSSFMVNYLTKNTFQFSLPDKPINWYLYIRLKKPTSNTIFAYWYNTKLNWYTVSWDLDKQNNLIDSDSELLFKLDNISYIPYHQNWVKIFDWLSKLKKWNQNFIAWFVRDYDWGNKIQEITIVWE